MAESNITLMNTRRTFDIFVSNPNSKFTLKEISEWVSYGQKYSKVEKHLTLLMYFGLVRRVKNGNMDYYILNQNWGVLNG